MTRPVFESYLIVEPDRVGRRCLDLFCHKTAKRVKAVTSAEQALAVPPFSFDCMLIEMRLPGITGLELAAEIRATAATTRFIPFLVGITADLHRYKREHCLAAGMDAFFEKPIDWAELKRVLGIF